MNTRPITSWWLLGVVAVVLSNPLFTSCGRGGNKENGTSKHGVQADTGSFDTKLQLLNQQIAASPSNGDLYHQRAKLYLKHAKYQEALNDVSRSVGIDSTNADYQYTKGEIYFLALRFDNALLTFEKTLQLNPQHWKANLKMAKIFLYLEQYEKAMDYVNAALRVDEHLAEGYFLKGTIHQFAGDSAKAASSFRTAVEQKADYYDAYISLGMLYSAVNNDLALEYFKTALSLRPGSIEAMYNTAIYLQDHERLSEAEEMYRQILKVRENFEIAYHNMGYMELVYKLDFNKAVEKFDSALLINPQYLSALHNRGVAYTELKEYKKARADFKMALAIDPQYEKSALELDRMDRNGWR